jgi:hypothetical protein
LIADCEKLNIASANLTLVLSRELTLLRIFRNGKAVTPLVIALIVLGVAIVLVAGTLIAYYASGVGNLKTETKQFSDFTKLDIGSAFEVTITRSSTYSVTVTASQGVVDRIDITKSDDTLSIQLQPGVILGASTLKADISMPVLNGVTFSGAAHGTASGGFSTTAGFTANLNGASTFEITDLTTQNAHVDLSGASSFTAQGTGNDLVAVVSGASNLQLSSFHTNNTTVELSGASHATVNLNGRLDVTASGFSSLVYYGNPTLGNIDTSGGSTVSKG